MNDLYEAGVDDDIFALIYESNRENYVAVKTPNGISRRETFKDIVMQGDVHSFIRVYCHIINTTYVHIFTRPLRCQNMTFCGWQSDHLQVRVGGSVLRLGGAQATGKTQKVKSITECNPCTGTGQHHPE